MGKTAKNTDETGSQVHPMVMLLCSCGHSKLSHDYWGDKDCSECNCENFVHDQELSNIKHRIEETMAAAHLPGVCEASRKRDGDIFLTFDFNGGHRSPVSIGGKLSEIRTWEYFAKKAAVTFLQHIPYSVGDEA